MKNAFPSIVVLAGALSLPGLVAAGWNTSWLDGWRVSGGGNIGFGLKSSLRLTPSGASTAAANADAATAITPTRGGDRINYNNDGTWFVDPNSNGGDPSRTWNWSLPESAGHVYDSSLAPGVDYFTMSRDWMGYRTASGAAGHASNDEVAYGASVDFSRLLYTGENGTWGVEMVIGLQYLTANNCFKSSGGCGVEKGVNSVNIWVDGGPMSNPGGSASGYAADNGMYGPGNGDALGVGVHRPSLYIDGADTLDATSVSRVAPLKANGDYEELEISLLLRPWYDVFDWWRLRGAIGVGVTRSEFDYAISAALGGTTIYSSHESFDEWRCYGLAGLGTSFYWNEFDLGFDCMFRFCQDDMDINGRDVQGSLEKPNIVLRISLGYSF